MRLVIGCHSFASLGGTQSYTLTVAEQLQRLGHQVTVLAGEQGEMAALARERGIRLAATATELPERCDGVLAQEAVTGYELAGRYASSPRLYVAHTTEVAGQLPPQLTGSIGTLIVLNDRVGARCRALADRPDLVRLTQPVDLERFGRAANPAPRPKRVVVFGNQQGGPAYEAIRRICFELGLDVTLVGAHGQPTATPEIVLDDADVVFGIGRCAVEGMAARAAVYVSGIAGTDGWVTPESYAALEADGFSGRATDAVFEPARVEADLRQWDAGMGEQNGDLAYRHHDAAKHAQALVELWERSEGGSAAPSGAEEELARSAREQLRLETRAADFAMQARIARAEQQRLEARLARVVSDLEAFKRTRRYRLAAAMVRPLDRARAHLDRIRARHH